MNYSDFGIEIPHGRFSGEVTTTCPKCSADRKKKNVKCLGVNLDKKIWNCSHCGWKGALKIEKEIIKYEKPKWSNKTELSDKVIKWFEDRKISQNTLIKAKITEGLEFMPQVSKECNTIQFNYFRNDELINVKYRTADKYFKMFKDAELIFYNIDCLKEAKEVYIVEGEMDCLAMIEVGKLNVISVPNGANLNTNNLKYIDNCIELFNDIQKIHLAVDNDIAGRNLREQLSERFGKERCDYVEFKDCKDANDCLIKYGIDGIIESCNNPKEFPLEGVFTISDYSDAIDDMYENGLDKGINLGIDGFELNIVKGYITTITGIPSHGKSDWLDNICVHARVKHGWNGAFYSPENKPTQLHFSKMARKLIGKHWDGEGKMNYLEVKLVKEYLDKKFWFLKPEKNFDLTSILAQVRSLQQRHGLDFFVIDAWNKLYHKETDTGAVGKSMDELALFCELNNLHCFLVAHPTKMPKEQDGTYQVPTLYNIAGSSNFYNKTDNGICVYRDFEHNTTKVYRQKVKFDHWGVEGQSEYIYDVPSKRYFPIGKADFTNWITKENVQQTLQPNTNFINPDKRIEPIKDEDIYPF